MPRGMNPNSRKNLEKSYNGDKGFSTETARKAQKKSVESKRANGLLRSAFMESITSDSAARIADAHRRKAEHGNEGSTRLIMELLGEDQKRHLEMEKLRAEIRKLQAELEPQNDNDQVMEFIEALKKHAYPEPETD